MTVVIVQTQTPLNHLVLVALSVVATNAQVKVLADSTVPACLDMVFTFVAGVDKAVLALVVQFYQHAHGAPLASPQRAELPVLIPC